MYFIFYNDGDFSVLKENKLIQKFIEIYNTLTSKIDNNIDEKLTPESISPFLDYDNNSQIQVNTLNYKDEYLNYNWYTDPNIIFAGLFVGFLLVLNYYGINIDDDDKVTFSISRVSSGVLILLYYF